jgi:hypothetical protein
MPADGGITPGRRALRRSGSGLVADIEERFFDCVCQPFIRKADEREEKNRHTPLRMTAHVGGCSFSVENATGAGSDLAENR